MREELNREAFHEAIDTTLSGLQADPWLAKRIVNLEKEGQTGMKKKWSLSVVLVIALLLVAVTALAVALLSPKEVVEQVAVPMAQENDKDWRIETEFSPEELAAFIQAANENGIDLDENHAIMEAIRNGEGYNEEEAIMAVCRIAFGGNYGTWTLAEQHWFDEMMVAIGFGTEVHTELPGDDDLTEEDARARMLAAIREKVGEDIPLEDKTQYSVMISFEPVSASDEPSWWLYVLPLIEDGRDNYVAVLDKQGNVLEVAVTPGERHTSSTDAEDKPVFTLTEEEAIHVAAEAIREANKVDTPLEDPAYYRWFVVKSQSGEPRWHINFISLTVNGGFCETVVNDATREVIIDSADVAAITADNILSRYRAAYGWYDAWDSTIWAEVAERATGLPADTMAGRVVKATPWIAWHEGLLTKDEAEEQAFRQTGVRLGDVNCASLIDAEPNPLWKFRIIPYDDSYHDSIVVEIDAVTGEMTDLDMYKSDSDLEPSFHMVTLHRIWAKLELEENGPLYLASMAVLKKYADLSFDLPEVDSLPIFNEELWVPEIDGLTVRFRSQFSNQTDYQVTLDENGIPTEIVELPSSGTEEMPEDTGNG